MNWLDSHCHINDEAFKDDLNDVLLNMKNSNVTKAMIVSSFIDDYKYARSIKCDGIDFKYSLGVYPGDVNEIKVEEYEKYYSEVDAIGEIGLDYHYGKDSKDKQLEVFRKQCELANKYNKPIIVHSREAIQDTYDILKEYRCKGVMHCYSDSKEMAVEFVKLGYYISIAGTVTWKNAKEPLEVVKAVPIDRLLIETDCPYLTPAPNRGKRNEPSYVVYTGKKICEILEIDEESFKKQINENYQRLFG